jgi:hypothetical protein
MPRTTESLEGRVLRYFQQAPLDAAKMLLALVREQMQLRTPKLAVSIHTDSVKPPAAAKKQSHHKHVGATTPLPKKSHHKKKVNAGTGKRQQTNEAEVESFSLP